MPAIPNFVSQAYTSVSPNVACETLKNWYPQSVEVGGEKAQVIYLPTPGLSVLARLPDSPVRGIFSQDGRTFAVGGSTFFELDAAWNVVYRGTLTAADSNPATMCSSGTIGNQVYITSGGKGAIFNTSTNVFAMITAAGYPTGTVRGTYQDTYFLTTLGNSPQLNISNILDGTLWNTLDKAKRQSAGSDNWMGIISNNQIVWLIGSRTSEAWYNSGAASFPFVALPQILVPSGTSAPFSIVRAAAGANGAVAWLQQSERGRGSFVMAESFVPARISTDAVEAIWATYPTINDCAAYCYTDQGHEFLVVTFPSGNATWVCDLSERGRPWHQRTWYNAVTGTDDRHRGWVHAFANGLHLVGDWQNGNIYQQDVSFVTDQDTVIVRERQSPHLASENQMLFFSDFQLDFETGLDLLNTGTETVNLQWSNDGGHTFSSAIPMSMGRTGDYVARCRAPGTLGSGRNRVWRIRNSTLTPVRGLMQAYVSVEKGTS